MYSFFVSVWYMYNVDHMYLEYSIFQSMHKNNSVQPNLLEDKLKKDHGCLLANQAKSLKFITEYGG